MTTLLLIRHGQNDFVGKRLAGRLPGVHLNERGRQQAQTIALALCKAPIKAIYSSPLERAIETAEPLSQALHLPVQISPGLIELDFGTWTGKTGKQMARTKLWKVVQQAPSKMVFPAGESFVQAQQRIAAELESIAAAHDEKDLVACFSHSDAIKLAVAYFLGMPLDNFQRLAVDVTSITTLTLPKEGSPRFWLINQILGLEFKGEEKKPGSENRKKRVESGE
jgi:probable phosphoglycerate mutase